ncbi:MULTISPECIES: hypothetical protein [unclassified Rhizobium]|uniref:hypothetical protein n=1 Tax=unclassified Rhizobium TaxID=2613769 RepID=UPI00130424EC|nr:MULTISPECIES: hypothetical protein [unclassified Rhizobium]MDK4715290.1 hypothetical protein [Rhizobium sp. CNPSo 4039]
MKTVRKAALPYFQVSKMMLIDHQEKIDAAAIPIVFLAATIESGVMSFVKHCTDIKPR